jgi:hypothetical protein
VVAARDVLVQEIMSLDKSEFEGSKIDLDSINFSLSAVQDIAKKYLEPEPFLQPNKETSPLTGGGSLWQNLAQSVVAAAPVSSTVSLLSEGDATGLGDTYPSDWRGQDDDKGGSSARPSIYDQQQQQARWQLTESQLQPEGNSNGWSLPRYPTQQTGYEIKSNLVRSPAYSNVVTPQSPLIISQQKASNNIVSDDTNLPVITAPPQRGYPGNLQPGYPVGIS